MKFCPVCQTRYDEEILRFCPLDGTPLVDENPSFTAMPSSSDSASDDIDEETQIRRNPPKEVPLAQPEFDQSSDTGQRIVISTTEDFPITEVEQEPEFEPSPVRAKPQPEYHQVPERKSNTALIVLTTILGTIVVLGGLSGIFYMLQNRNESNSNSNSNRVVNANNNSAIANLNSNTNFNADNSLSNFSINSNENANINVNVNVNANLKTPTPTRSPTPKPSVTPLDSNVNSAGNINLGNTNVMSTPTVSPTLTPTPRTTASPTAPPQNVNVGVMNSRAVSLTKPAYPQNAKQVNASGQVTVQISVDENGNVTSARALSGHPLLRPAAENAARQSRFNPVKVNDRAVSANGLLVYNFIDQ